MHQQLQQRSGAHSGARNTTLNRFFHRFRVKSFEFFVGSNYYGGAYFLLGWPRELDHAAVIWKVNNRGRFLYVIGGIFICWDGRSIGFIVDPRPLRLERVFRQQGITWHT